jgi:hypothetical protein
MDPHTREDHVRAVQLGEDVGRFLESEGGRAVLALTRARIYEEWKGGASVALRERAHAEDMALDRLLEALEQFHTSGLVSQQALDILDAQEE